MADRKIDVHAHFVPDFYRKALLDHGISNPDGMPGVPEWSVEGHLEFMQTTGIKKSILSLTSPGTSISDDPAYTKSLTRQINEYAAKVKQQHPDRFGFFASLPFGNQKGPGTSVDAAAALEEIEYALNTLNADGFVLYSNNEGTYPGDSQLRPVLEELNKRNAIVLLHPSTPCCPKVPGLEQQQPLSYAEKYTLSSPLASAYPAPMFEFFLDSARASLDLLISGTIVRFPAIRWVITHCGNVLPCLLDRMFLALRLGRKLSQTRDVIDMTEDQIRQAFRNQLWFDLAGEPIPNQLQFLLKFTDKDRIVFGSDVPWTPWKVTEALVGRLEAGLGEIVGPENVGLVWEENARKLLGPARPDE